MNEKIRSALNIAWLIVVVAVSIIICLSIISVNLSDQTADAGQVIRFNGETLDLSGPSNVMVQSSEMVRTWGADASGGAITQTTSIVTVTIWAKP